MSLAVTVVRIGVNSKCYNKGSKYFLPMSLNSNLNTKVRNSHYVYLLGNKPFVPSKLLGKVQSFIIFAVDRNQMMTMREEAGKYTHNVEGHLYGDILDKEEEEDWWRGSNGCQLHLLPRKQFSYADCIKFTMAKIHTTYWWYRKNEEWQKANPITEFQKSSFLKRKAVEGNCLLGKDDDSSDEALEAAPFKKMTIKAFEDDDKVAKTINQGERVATPVTDESVTFDHGKQPLDKEMEEDDILTGAKDVGSGVVINLETGDLSMAAQAGIMESYEESLLEPLPSEAPSGVKISSYEANIARGTELAKLLEEEETNLKAARRSADKLYHRSKVEGLKLELKAWYEAHRLGKCEARRTSPRSSLHT